MRIAAFVIAGLAGCFGLLAQSAAQPDEQRSLLEATELIQVADVQALAIAKLTAMAALEAVDVSELPREDASEQLLVATMERFTTRYRDEVAALREAIAENPVVAEALAEAGIEPSDVVAAEISPDLSLTVYTYDL